MRRSTWGLSVGDVLAKAPLFAGLFRAREYARGEVIFLEGDEGSAKRP
jgi:hypothetical protein